MPGKPFQSALIPYQAEIADLRSQTPPVSYARIADLLRQKYGFNIQRAAIGKFVKVRARGRKVYFFRPEMPKKESAPTQAYAPVVKTDAKVVSAKSEQSKPFFEFPYSERYNLHRLPPEQAEAWRKKLEAEGH